MAAVLPTTFTYVDDAGATVEATKSWVLNWDKVASASWFAVPKIMPVKWVFDARAIVPICIMFIVTAVETVGDISGITEGGLGREATDKDFWRRYVRWSWIFTGSSIWRTSEYFL